MCVKYLKLNDSKTKFVLLCKPSIQTLLLSNHCKYSIDINSCKIDEVDWDLDTEIKSLGVYLN